MKNDTISGIFDFRIESDCRQNIRTIPAGHSHRMTNDVDWNFFSSRLIKVGNVAHKNGNKAVVELVNFHLRLAERKMAEGRPIWLKAA